MMKPEGIGKAPSLNFIERQTFSLAAHDSFLPKERVMNVAVLWRHIEVAAKNYRRIQLVAIVKKVAQPSYPVKLKLKLFRAHRLTVRNIHVDDANTRKSAGQQPCVCSFLIFIIATLHVNASCRAMIATPL